MLSLHCPAAFFGYVTSFPQCIFVTLRILHRSLYPARSSDTKPGIGNDWGESKPDGSVCLPPRLLPRMDVLTPDGIYMAFNGSALYVWLGKSCDASCIHEMFGFSSVDQADGAQARAQFTRCFARLKLLQQALLFTRKTSVRCVPTQPLHSHPTPSFTCLFHFLR